MKNLLSLVFSLFFLNVTPLHGACSVNPVQFRIDLFTPNPVIFTDTILTQTINFNVTHTVSPTGPPFDCNYFTAFSYGHAEGFGGEPASRTLCTDSACSNLINYNIYKNNSFSPARRLRDLRHVTNANHVVRSPIFNGGVYPRTNSHTFYAQMAAPPAGPPGIYVDALVAKLVEVASPLPIASWPIRGTRGISFAHVIPTSINVSIVDDGAGYDAVDVGQLVLFHPITSGAFHDFDLYVDTNAGYELYFQSMNWTGAPATVSNLSHENPAITNTIPYSITCSRGGGCAGLSDLSGITQIDSELSTSIGQFLHNIRVTIGTVPGNTPAGVYSDAIIIRAVAP